MSNIARLLSEPEPQATPGAKPKPGGIGTAWFPWCVAICLAVLAYSTYQQLAIQRRLLVGSQELERIVAESRAVSSDTVVQLGHLRALDAATARMDEKLARIGQVNGSIRISLANLETTAEAIYRSVVTLDDQAGQSQALLAEVAGESAALHATLLQSQQVGEQLAGQLNLLVEAQEAINVDLQEMTAKTEFIDRMVRGE